MASSLFSGVDEQQRHQELAEQILRLINVRGTRREVQGSSSSGFTIETDWIALEGTHEIRFRHENTSTEHSENYSSPGYTDRTYSLTVEIRDSATNLSETAMYGHLWPFYQGWNDQVNSESPKFRDVSEIVERLLA